jgi:hypothetical protein
MKTRFVIASFLAALPVSAANSQPFAPTHLQLDVTRSAPVASKVGIEDAVYKRGFRFRDALANSQDKATAEPLPFLLCLSSFILDSATPVSRDVAPLPLIPRPAPSDTLQLPIFVLEQPTPSLRVEPEPEPYRPWMLATDKP